jgi:predicted ArsR family transcriptional regulator
MEHQQSLDFSRAYPQSPGYSEPDTSKKAAETVDAGTLRAIVLDAIERIGPMTADECAGRLGMSILTVRPRFTELKAMSLIRDSGRRHPNSSGRMAKVMEIAPEETPR